MRCRRRRRSPRRRAARRSRDVPEPARRATGLPGSLSRSNSLRKASSRNGGTRGVRSTCATCPSSVRCPVAKKMARPSRDHASESLERVGQGRHHPQLAAGERHQADVRESLACRARGWRSTGCRATTPAGGSRSAIPPVARGRHEALGLRLECAAPAVRDRRGRTRCACRRATASRRSRCAPASATWSCCRRSRSRPMRRVAGLERREHEAAGIGQPADVALDTRGRRRAGGVTAVLRRGGVDLAARDEGDLLSVGRQRQRREVARDTLALGFACGRRATSRDGDLACRAASRRRASRCRTRARRR